MIDPKWINADGFVTAQPNAVHLPGEGNGWLQTGLASACGLYPYGHNQVLQMYRNCKHATPGIPLIYRSPWKRNPDDQEACDDYWGLIVLLYNNGLLLILEDLLKWGEDHDWHYDVQDPKREDIRYRFDRFASFVPLLRLSIGENLSLLDSIAVISTIIWDSIFISSADGNKKAYCRIYMFRSHGYLFPLICNLWFYRIKKRYGTIGKSWAASLADGHALSEHKE